MERRMADPRICSVDGCNKNKLARGYCRAHYERWHRYGDPTAGRPSSTEEGIPLQWLTDNYMADQEECLVWPFGRISSGYGKVRHEGREQYVHRLVCEWVYGEPPSPDHHAAHSCGKGHEGCLNRRHLSWKTPLENVADTFEHGTWAHGEKQGSAKLTSEQVISIRAALKRGLTQASIAEEYGVHPGTISKIAVGTRWAWLE